MDQRPIARYTANMKADFFKGPWCPLFGGKIRVRILAITPRSSMAAIIVKGPSQETGASPCSLPQFVRPYGIVETPPVNVMADKFVKPVAPDSCSLYIRVDRQESME